MRYTNDRLEKIAHSMDWIIQSMKEKIKEADSMEKKWNCVDQAMSDMEALQRNPELTGKKTFPVGTGNARTGNLKGIGDVPIVVYDGETTCPVKEMYVDDTGLVLKTDMKKSRIFRDVPSIYEKKSHRGVAVQVYLFGEPFMAVSKDVGVCPEEIYIPNMDWLLYKFLDLGHVFYALELKKEAVVLITKSVPEDGWEALVSDVLREEKVPMRRLPKVLEDAEILADCEVRKKYNIKPWAAVLPRLFDNDIKQIVKQQLVDAGYYDLESLWLKEDSKIMDKVSYYLS